MTVWVGPRDKLYERIEALVLPVVEAQELELYDIEMTTRRGERVVCVLIDRPGGHAKGQGVALEEIVEVTRELSALFDVEEPMQGRYRLEVFSPGIERSLTRPVHFDKLVGDRVHVVFNRMIDGRSVIDGVLRGREEHDALIEDGQGASWRVPLAAIKKAHTVFEW